MKIEVSVSEFLNGLLHSLTEFPSLCFFILKTMDEAVPSSLSLGDVQSR